jgi:dipeptidyl aminopeptidase/acylaminoacyl peptidase
MNADGTNATTIYNFPSGNFVNKVSWSPGGGSIAFMDGGSVCRIDVSVVNGVPVGSNHVVLVASGTGAAYTSPAWSPLGDEIAFVHVQSHSLMTVPAPGGTPQTIYTPPPGTLIVNYLAWSPDGAFIAFWEDGGGQGDNTIRILERATGQVTTALGPSDVGVGDLDWARTQDALVFVGDPDGGYYTGIWLLSLSQGGSLQFIRDAHAASWSPDDSQLVITSGSGVTKLERLNLATGAVTSLGSKGSRPDWRRF